jgi:hypothetical protein
MTSQPGDDMPGWSVTLPLHPEVCAVAHGFDSNEVVIRYYGTPEELINAGVATAEMLAPGRSGRKVDADGDRYSVQRYFRLKDGHPYRCCRIILRKRTELIDRLPGARDAVAAAERLERWREDHRARVQAQRRSRLASASKPRPSHLRLIVDNTR